MERGGNEIIRVFFYIFNIFLFFADITQDDLDTALPYENTFDVGEIEGSKLKEVFEYDTISEEDGQIRLKLLQVSGKC